jgi:hypothetical protein
MDEISRAIIKFFPEEIDDMAAMNALISVLARSLVQLVSTDKEIMAMVNKIMPGVLAEQRASIGTST